MLETKLETIATIAEHKYWTIKSKQNSLSQRVIATSLPILMMGEGEICSFRNV